MTLLGDAAHPMKPNLGQGAAQALEDAVVLGSCLSGSGDPEEVFMDVGTRVIADGQGRY